MSYWLLPSYSWNNYTYYFATPTGNGVWEPDATFDIVAVGAQGADHFVTGEGDDILFGYVGNDILVPAGGDDSVHGGDGDDAIHTGTGHDTLNGGNGDDTLTLFKEEDAGWLVDLDGGYGLQLVGDIFQGGHLNTAEIRNIENVHGSSGDDTIRGDDGANELTDGGSYYFKENDYIEGRGGHDTITSSGGSDTISGGAGNDRIVVREHANDHSITGGEGTDVFEFRDHSAQSGRIATIEDFDIYEYDRIQIDSDFVWNEFGYSEYEVFAQKIFLYDQFEDVATLYFDRNGDAVSDYTIDVVMQGGIDFHHAIDMIYA